MTGFSVVNGTAVGIYGMILSASFCDILWTKKKKYLMLVCMAGLLLLQGAAYVLFDYEVVQKLYPVLTHLPLAMILCIFTGRYLWSFISVFVAYLCCEMRRWLALLSVELFFGNLEVQSEAEFVLTVPLLLLLLKFAAPAVRNISRVSVSVQIQFGLIPMLEYGFVYLTQVYTDLLYSGRPLVAEFMFFVCSISYIFFVLRTSQEKFLRNQLENRQATLNLQMAQAVREIDLLRDSQQQARTYRHDLRHHMQYISTCIENGKSEQAQEYIQEIYADIEANKVTVYCENETVNLIFSAFADRAKKQGISVCIRAEISKALAVAERDVCVLCSNALENALNACVKLRKLQRFAEIKVTAYEKNGKLFMEFMNSCDKEVTLDKGVPVTNEPGHGMGVPSICAIVERYQGMYQFTIKDDNFILRVSL